MRRGDWWSVEVCGVAVDGGRMALGERDSDVNRYARGRVLASGRSMNIDLLSVITM